MNNIYTGIELGTDSIKFVVCEKKNDSFYVLGSVCGSSIGIKNGEIIDFKSAVSSIKNTLKDINEMVGVKINKAILCINPKDCEMNIVSGTCEVMDYNEIVGEDISNCLENALKDYDFNSRELVTAMPINFKIDEQDNILDPKGMKGKTISSKVVISTTSKDYLYRLLEVLKTSGIDIIDICFTSTGDYFTIKSREFDNVVGAIINIGEESTNVSIYNRGIQIKNSVISMGSLNVDKDIAYLFKTDKIESRNLKEKFCVAKATYADPNDIYSYITVDGEEKEVNQRGVSKVVEARIREILRLAKIEIKNLTNREIRYIIITGGLSEMAGFQYLIEDEFGFVAKVSNIPIIGIRHNKYSSVFGSIKYFDNKLTLRGKTYNMFSSEEYNELINSEQKININDNLVSKVFGHFFDN